MMKNALKIGFTLLIILGLWVSAKDLIQTVGVHPTKVPLVCEQRAFPDKVGGLNCCKRMTGVKTPFMDLKSEGKKVYECMIADKDNNFSTVFVEGEK